LADRLDGLPPADLAVLERAAELVDDLLAADRAPRDGSPDGER
jgi:hypothetical protein